jgi:hypothetical protein
MTEEIIKIKFKPHEKQGIVMDSPARFRILSAGRRFGKSYLAAAEAIKFGLKNSEQTIWCVAPVFSQTKRLWRAILKLLPYKLIKNINRSELCLELINRSIIWFKSADNPDSLRGEGINFLIMDEAAIIKREAWEAALRPALSDTQGQALFISTPKSFNWFHELFSRGQLPEEKDNFESWQFPTADSPFVEASEIEEAKRTLPQIVFRQEFLAEFLDLAGSVFRDVGGCIKGELQEPVQGKEYVIGADLAKFQDFSVLVVMDVESKHAVAFERFNELSWEFQKSKILALAKKYNGAKIVLDASGLGSPIYDDLCQNNANVEAFKFTNESKARLIESLAIAIEQKQLTFPNIPELITELHSFGFETLPSGRMRYTAPNGLHDDTVIALALAWKGSKETESFVVLERLGQLFDRDF